MSALDQVFNDKEGRDMLFTAGVEVGRVKGREEFAQHLIRVLRQRNNGDTHGMAGFIRGELLRIQRGEV